MPEPKKNPVPLEVPIKESVRTEKGVDATTLNFLIYTLYKMNIMTRLNVKEYLQFIKNGNHPDDILAYMMQEIKKI